MKKIINFNLAIGYLFLSASCEIDDSENLDASTNQELSVSEDNIIVQESTIDGYSFKDKIYELKNYSSKESDLSSILELPELVIYYDGSSTIQLFENHSKYMSYMNNFSSRKSEQSRSQRGTTRIGVAGCWEHSNYRVNQLYFRERDNWGFLRISTMSYPGGGTWNDRISSIRVNNGAVEFYMDASIDSGTFNPGRILVVHDPNNDPTQAVGISDLDTRWATFSYLE